MEAVDSQFQSFVDHVYFMSFYGLFAWVIFHYNYRKTAYAKRKLLLLELLSEGGIDIQERKTLTKELLLLQQKYGYVKKWWSENVSNLLAAIVISFSVVAWDDEMISLYNGFVQEDITWQKGYYLLPPFLTMSILKFIFKDQKLI